jgi:hypothetical protein
VPRLRALLGVVQLVTISWLSVGCFLAVLGWWSYARHRRTDTEANQDGLESAKPDFQSLKKPGAKES